MKNGQYEGIFYTIISFIIGKDIGDIYHELNDIQKQNIVKELVIIQRKVVFFYTLLYCIDFMGEQGMQFNNGNIVIYDQNMIKNLNSIYDYIKEKII